MKTATPRGFFQINALSQGRPGTQLTYYGQFIKVPEGWILSYFDAGLASPLSRSYKVLGTSDVFGWSGFTLRFAMIQLTRMHILDCFNTALMQLLLNCTTQLLFVYLIVICALQYISLFIVNSCIVSNTVVHVINNRYRP